MEFQQLEPDALTKKSLTKPHQPGDFHVVKKQVEVESLQALYKWRSELKPTQKDAYTQCKFPTNTFHHIENKISVPTEKQQNVIQRVIGVQYKIILKLFLLSLSIVELIVNYIIYIYLIVL